VSAHVRVREQESERKCQSKHEISTLLHFDCLQNKNVNTSRQKVMGANIRETERVLERIIAVAVCCSVLQCVAVCCSVLQCAAVCCCVFQCVAVCCSVLQCVAVCCSVVQCVAVCCSVLQRVSVCCSVLLCFAVFCCVLLCVAVCCSALQCVAMCCNALKCVAVRCSVVQCVFGGLVCNVRSVHQRPTQYCSVSVFMYTTNSKWI